MLGMNLISPEAPRLLRIEQYRATGSAQTEPASSNEGSRIRCGPVPPRSVNDGGVCNSKVRLAHQVGKTRHRNGSQDAL